MTAECRANRRDELVASRIFQDVSKRTGRQSCLHQHQLGMHGDEHDTGIRVAAPDQSDCLDTIDTRHGNVGDNHVRREPLRRVHQSVTVLDRRNDVEVRSEELAQPFRRLRCDPRLAALVGGTWWDANMNCAFLTRCVAQGRGEKHEGVPRKTTGE